MSENKTTIDDATLDFAKEIVGTTWIPVPRQRLDLEIRIADALANAEARAQAAERDLDRTLAKIEKALKDADGEQKGYEAAKVEMRGG